MLAKKKTRQYNKIAVLNIQHCCLIKASTKKIIWLEKTICVILAV